jgi:hypothetical protein
VAPKEFEEAIAVLGLSQVGAGRFLKIGDRQIRKWIAGDARIPESAAMLLRLLIALKITPEQVEAMQEVKQAKAPKRTPRRQQA